jgi:hypothetical protein
MILANNARDIIALKFRGNPFRSKLTRAIIKVNKTTATNSGLRIRAKPNKTAPANKKIRLKVEFELLVRF